MKDNPARIGDMRVPMRGSITSPPITRKAEPPPARPSPKKSTRTGMAFELLEYLPDHFNSGQMKDAIDAYLDLLDRGGQMFLAMAGAMSTAGIGKTLAPMIREGKIHGISCTGANLEEDLFRLVAHTKYKRLPHYQNLTPEEDQRLFQQHHNRVTDVTIPEKAAMTPIEDAVERRWKQADRAGARVFVQDVLFDIIRSGELEEHYEGDPADSWLVAAAEKDLLVVVPGNADATLGNVRQAGIRKKSYRATTFTTDDEHMLRLADWYAKTRKQHEIGFFQIGGGIAGDFSICVVPMLMQDAEEKDTDLWSYFCQITDATESYGGYSGAMPNEKITWGKIGPKTPRFSINSDATIVAPLMFLAVLGR